jgi:hypothetical protein
MSQEKPEEINGAMIEGAENKESVETAEGQEEEITKESKEFKLSDEDRKNFIERRRTLREGVQKDIDVIDELTHMKFPQKAREFLDKYYYQLGVLDGDGKGAYESALAGKEVETGHLDSVMLEDYLTKLTAWVPDDGYGKQFDKLDDFRRVVSGMAMDLKDYTDTLEKIDQATK